VGTIPFTVARKAASPRNHPSPSRNRIESQSVSLRSIPWSLDRGVEGIVCDTRVVCVLVRLRECIPVSDNTTTTGDLTTTYVMLYHSMYLSSSRVEVVNGNFTTAIVVGRKVELTTTREVEISS
jgi:hypothetical protein